MTADVYPLAVLLVTLAGWVNRHQQHVIEYRVEVNRVLEGQRGEAPFFNISSPGTDSRVFRRVGIPVAVFGPTPYGMGAASECVTVADYLDTVRVHALSALEFLQAAGGDA